MNFKKELHTIFEYPRRHKYGILIQSLIFFNIFISIVIMFLQTEKSLIDYYDIFLAEECNYFIYQKLCEWHFDIFGLIDAGLAVDINTVKF